MLRNRDSLTYLQNRDLTWEKGSRALIKCNEGMQKLFNIKECLEMGKNQSKDSEMAKMAKNWGNMPPNEVRAKMLVWMDIRKASMNKKLLT